MPVEVAVLMFDPIPGLFEPERNSQSLALIPNASSPVNPALRDDLEAAFCYARTVDGYAYGRARWDIESLDGSADAKVTEIERSMESNEASFEDLRYALFAIQRGIAWGGGSGPTDELDVRFQAVHAALCRAWEREWTQHAADLSDLSVVGVEKPVATDFLRIDRPQEIRLLDPAVGSGHMLTYAFDLLYRIYEEEGYAASEIPRLILRHNLYGVEISARAAQLAELALVFKARERSRGFFRPENLVRPRILALRNARFAEGELKEYVAALGLGDLFNQPMLKQMYQFEEAENFGSLIQPRMDERQIAFARRVIEAKDMGGQLFLRETHRKVLRVLEQAEILTQQYHVIVANPPYMGGKGMNVRLSDFTKENYPESKSDLMTCFMERAWGLTINGGYWGTINIPSWMFISSFKEFRASLLMGNAIQSLLHLGRGLFGADFGTVAFVLRHAKVGVSEKGFYGRLFVESVHVRTPEKIHQIFLNGEFKKFTTAQSDFVKIPGNPISYWASAKAIRAFEEYPPVSKISEKRLGLCTGDNDAFIRQWNEISYSDIGFSRKSCDDFLSAGYKYAPHNKGGQSIKWYGNHDLVIKFAAPSFAILSISCNKLASKSHYFRKCISWSEIGHYFAVRYYPEGFVFNIKGPSVFADDDTLAVLLAYYNSNVFKHLLGFVSQSMSFNGGDVEKVPFPVLSPASKNSIVRNSNSCLSIARADYSGSETSWDFATLPMLSFDLRRATLEDSYTVLRTRWRVMVTEMQQIEADNNRIFVDGFDLKEDLTPHVPVEEVSLNCNPAYRYGGSKTELGLEEALRADTMRELLNYSVGCMMGRYSLDQPGLVLADTGATFDDFLAKVSVLAPVDGNTAIREPESVVVRPDSRPSCFACGCALTMREARFILADLYDRQPDQITGRPMVYCPDCVAAKRADIVLDIPLAEFAFAEGLRQRWTEPETFAMFVNMAGCFGRRVPATRETLTFTPDEDGIVPVLDGEWFEDDIVARTREFLRATFGEETLRENVRFLETSLGKDLRRYFLTDFYKDHLQTYKKRPIYWLVQSPDRGFAVLIYLHRYTRDTLNLVLNRYLREYLTKLRTRLAHLAQAQVNVSASARDKTAARKEGDKLARVLRECEEWERQTLLPMAQARIELDLDDGVKVNYLKLAPVLAPIPGLAAKEED